MKKVNTKYADINNAYASFSIVSSEITSCNSVL